jgi:hypothetical protein
MVSDSLSALSLYSRSTSDPVITSFTSSFTDWDFEELIYNINCGVFGTIDLIYPTSTPDTECMVGEICKIKVGPYTNDNGCDDII